MKLITIAHRGEAKSFIHKLDHIKGLPFEGAYKGSEYFLLITGEGYFESALKLSAFLAAYKEVTEVINMGIAGALDASATLGQIYPVRTIYSEGVDESDQLLMEFKSFTTFHSGNLDLVTAHKRVIDSKYKSDLSNFGSIVDREAWGMAKAVKLMGLPFHCYKLISDNSDDKEICKITKESADQFSDQLFEYFNSNLIENSPSQKKEEAKSILDSNPNYYFSVSQKRQYQTLLESLKRKGYSESEVIKGIEKDLEKLSFKLPKHRSSKLIEQMKLLLTPLKIKINQRLDELTQGIRDTGAKVIFDPEYERDSLQLSAKLESPIELKRLTDQLQKFDYSKAISALKGELDQ